MLLDALEDIVKHTHSLGIQEVKVLGSATTAKIETKDTDNTVIIYGEMYQPISGLDSTVGLSRMDVLKGFMGYHKGSTVTLINEIRNNVSSPTELLFDDGNDGTAHYRFMSEAMITEIVKVPAFKGANWDVVIQPETKAIANLAASTGILGGLEKRFITSVVKGNLFFSVGNGPVDRINIKFANNVTGSLKHQWTYPLSQVLSILKLTDSSSSATMSFSDAGALKIDVDSGIGKYTYILPAGKA